MFFYHKLKSFVRVGDPHLYITAIDYYLFVFHSAISRLREQDWNSHCSHSLNPIFCQMIFCNQGINLTIGTKLDSHTIAGCALCYCFWECARTLHPSIHRRRRRHFFCLRQTIRAHPPRDNWFRRGGDVGAPWKVLSRWTAECDDTRRRVLRRSTDVLKKLPTS